MVSHAVVFPARPGRTVIGLAAGLVGLAVALSGAGVLSADEKPAAKGDAKPTAVDVKTGKLKEMQAFLAAHKGKVVVIDFWATWCEPCKEMFPHLVKMHEHHHADGLRVLGVSIDDVSESAEVKKFAKEGKAYFPILIFDFSDDGWDAAATQLNKTLFPEYKYGGGVPVTLVFGRDGKLVKAWLDKAPEKDLDDTVAKALAAK